jgi:hypothetical protein
MGEKTPKTKLGAALASFGTKAATLLTLGGRVPASWRPSRQVEKREESNPTIAITTNLSSRQQRRRATVKGRRSKLRQRSRRISRKRSLIRVFSIVITLLGIVSSVIAIYGLLSSRVTVSPSSPLMPQDPFSTMFTISNDGPLAIYDVYASCHVNVVRGVSVGELHMEGDGGEINYKEAEEIDSGDKINLSCFKDQVEASKPWLSGDVDINVSYRPSFYPGHQERKARFIGERGADGGLHWFQQPTESNRR